MPASEDILAKLSPEQIDHFRVAIFGSARTKPEEIAYKDAYCLSKKLGEDHIDVITGGGPGIMQAANQGHSAGDPNGLSQSIGLTIQLPWESSNAFLDQKQHFQKFSNRLDTFMKLSNVVVVMPGGIGTCLELFYTWQLVQVGHICTIPIILVGDMWKDLLIWIEKDLLAQGMISPADMKRVVCVDTCDEAYSLIHQAQNVYEKNPNHCINLQKYR